MASLCTTSNTVGQPSGSAAQTSTHGLCRNSKVSTQFVFPSRLRTGRRRARAPNGSSLSRSISSSIRLSRSGSTSISDSNQRSMSGSYRGSRTRQRLSRRPRGRVTRPSPRCARAARSCRSSSASSRASKALMVTAGSSTMAPSGCSEMMKVALGRPRDIRPRPSVVMECGAAVVVMTLTVAVMPRRGTTPDGQRSSG